jgi:hypothetical protein
MVVVYIVEISQSILSGRGPGRCTIAKLTPTHSASLWLGVGTTEKGRSKIGPNLLVRKGGLEPPRFYPPDPKSGASANSATFATRNGLYKAAELSSQSLSRLNRD